MQFLCLAVRPRHKNPDFICFGHIARVPEGWKGHQLDVGTSSWKYCIHLPSSLPPSFFLSLQLNAFL